LPIVYRLKAGDNQLLMIISINLFLFELNQTNFGLKLGQCEFLKGSS